MATRHRRSRSWWSASRWFDRTIAVLFVVLVMNSSCFAQDKQITVTVRMSEETVIEGYADADSTCTPVELPRLTLVKAPEHGFVCSRIEEFEVASDSASDRACVGRWVRGISLFYTPRPGYAGPDSLRYETISDQRLDRASVRVTVLPGSAPYSSGAAIPDDSSSEPIMSIGPVPVCVGPVS